MTAVLDLLADCYDSPGLFHEAILGRPPLHSKQEAIADSVCRNRVTVVPAAHAVGKSWGAATTVLHWLDTRPDSKVITTSASNNQLVSVLWAAIKGAHGRSRLRLPGTLSDGNAIPQRLQIGPEWFAIGFSAKKPESFSGFHGDDVLVVVDEASGVEQSVWDAIEGMGYTSLLALGNPIRATGHFRTLWDLAAAGAPGYAGFNLTAFDSPYAHLTDDEIKARGLPRGLTSRTWIDGIRRTYGEGSLYWKTRVLAQFPDEDHDVLIPAEWLAHAIAAVRDRPPFSPALSVDISKGTGRDRTVWLIGDDFGLLHLEASNTTSLPAAAARTMELCVAWGVPHARVIYDAGGWAGPDFRKHLEALGCRDAVPYTGGQAGGRKWKNRRTRAAWGLRQRLTPDRPRMLPQPPPPMPDDAYPEIAGRYRAPKPPIADERQPPWSIPPHVVGAHLDDLRRELAALRYSFSDDGQKHALEPKEELVARLGHSPDLADATIMLASLLWSPE
jgi:phage terminase large subunit